MTVKEDEIRDEIIEVPPRKEKGIDNELEKKLRTELWEDGDRQPMIEVIKGKKTKVSERLLHKIGLEYITTEAGLAELSRKHNVGHRTLMNACAKRKWSDKRGIYRDERQDKLVSYVAKHDLEYHKKEIIKIRENFLNYWDGILAPVLLTLNDMKTEMDKKKVNPDYKIKIKPDELYRLSVVMEKAQENKLKCLGIDQKKVGIKALNDIVEGKEDVNVVQTMQEFLSGQSADNIIKAARTLGIAEENTTRSGVGIIPGTAGSH